ncbi:hypothetical protein J3A83DRAFT_4079084, partial [Scleroderma citrinum]
ITSNATCTPDFNWMNNQEQSSPCLVVAYILAVCIGDSKLHCCLPVEWGDEYDPPNATTITPCYCSWSCYNLMMACTLCQYINASLSLWSYFSQVCPSTYSDKYFPTSYALFANEMIPYWASINSTTWPFGIFSVLQAQDYANKGMQDLTPSVSSTSKLSNLGPIVGSIVSGTTFIILAFGVYYLYRHQ